MTVDQILAAEDPVPLAARLLSNRPPSELPSELARFEEVLYFYGRIYGGGLSHAIGAAPDGAIPEALRLARTHGSPAVVSWESRLQAYFPTGLLFAPLQTREEWEMRYNDAPDPVFEQLYADSHKIEVELGRAVCQFLREHIHAFRQACP